ncbi:hypothetical protein B5807_06820 [Epicoccum nigrum]|uniref:Uncharacterized protein n=1 Tax=Epicoccum nigrum TaxID=105696 RepID=A0A1Y2LY94_EPING|nr:hypothetical protein B5807_06820 [Epicoccum nigrum]
MARLSRRISRFLPLSRRTSRETSPSTSPKISKASISHPIPSGPEDTHSLLCSPTIPHNMHGHSSSTYTISDAELRALEEEKLAGMGSGMGFGGGSRARVEDDIDEILAQYQSFSPSPSSPTTHSRAYSRAPKPSAGFHPSNPFADLEDGQILVQLDAGSTSSPACSSPSSSYSSSPPSSPPTVKAKLERFRDTPPPAPGWDCKVSFGRETRLFGPEGFVDFGGGVRAARNHAGGWREGGRRGYGML